MIRTLIKSGHHGMDICNTSDVDVILCVALRGVLELISPMPVVGSVVPLVGSLPPTT